MGKFCVGRQTFPAAFAPKSAVAHASEPGGGIEHIRAIYPDHASGQFRCDVQRQIDVLRPHGRGKAIARVVGHFYGLSGGPERRCDQHRPKDFLLHQRVRRMQPGDQSGRVKTTFCGHLNGCFVQVSGSVFRDQF